MEDITCIFDGVGAIGAIYLSNLKAAQNATLLNSNLPIYCYRPWYQSNCDCSSRWNREA